MLSCLDLTTAGAVAAATDDDDDDDDSSHDKDRNGGIDSAEQDSLN